jgi:poly(3-hydroxybutyrate) depolymerase
MFAAAVPVPGFDVVYVSLGDAEPDLIIRSNNNADVLFPATGGPKPVGMNSFTCVISSIDALTGNSNEPVVHVCGNVFIDVLCEGNHAI